MKKLLASAVLSIIGALVLSFVPIQGQFVSLVEVPVVSANEAPSFFTGNNVFSQKGDRYSLTKIRDELLPSVARFLGGFIGAIAVLALIWAGIMFLTAGGDPEKITKAAKTAFYIVAALILMTFAYALVFLFLTIFAPPTPPTPPPGSGTTTTTPTSPTTTPTTPPTTPTNPGGSGGLEGFETTPDPPS